MNLKTKSGFSRDRETNGSEKLRSNSPTLTRKNEQTLTPRFPKGSPKSFCGSRAHLSKKASWCETEETFENAQN